MPLYFWEYDDDEFFEDEDFDDEYWDDDDWDDDDDWGIDEVVPEYDPAEEILRQIEEEGFWDEYD